MYDIGTMLFAPDVGKVSAQSHFTSERTVTAMTELKPCPFCGNPQIGTVRTRHTGVPSGGDGWYAEIKCKCGASMKCWALKKSWAEETITKAWNHRAGEEEQDG